MLWDFLESSLSLGLYFSTCNFHGTVSMLAENAVKSTVNNYYTKNPNARTTNLGGTEAKMESISA